MSNIQRLVAEEHQLFEQGSLSDVEQKRLTSVQLELDQCWDLLRQRRARREFGRDPDEARARTPEVVEKYVG
ncbi:MAG: DUF2630 family protein [Burkholderiales bacterium]